MMPGTTFFHRSFLVVNDRERAIKLADQYLALMNTAEEQRYTESNLNAWQEAAKETLAVFDDVKEHLSPKVVPVEIRGRFLGFGQLLSSLASIGAGYAVRAVLGQGGSGDPGRSVLTGHPTLIAL